jgi:predicted kinase
MMRAGITDPNCPVVIVGLTEDNVRRLKNDQPIRAKLASFGVGLPGYVVICYGNTATELNRQLRRAGLIGPETEGETDPRLADEEALRERHAGDKMLICTVGLPRSGKSTWARSQAYPIVNPDAIRLAIHGQAFVGLAERFVWATVHAMVRALFLAGHDRVILDATNTTRKRRDEWRTDEWATFFKVFDADADECRRRLLAEAGDGEISETQHGLLKAIERMAGQFEPLQDDEERWP